ncbi:MAG: hypothetical protein QNI91_07575 [Arenicellales bacterium]|nr:hypothetical protein [Arenicellales bacterium]
MIRLIRFWDGLEPPPKKDRIHAFGQRVCSGILHFDRPPREPIDVVLGHRVKVLVLDDGSFEAACGDPDWLENTKRHKIKLGGSAVAHCFGPG